MKRCFYLLAICCTLFQVSTSAIDSTSIEITMDSLLRKMEIMEVELEMLKMERSDNSLLARGATLDWGKGLNLGVFYVQPYIFSGDIGYNFTIPLPILKKPKQPILTDSKNMLLGCALQFRQIHLNALDVINDEIDEQIAYSLGLKISFNSSVMLNFISTTIFICPFIQWGIHNDTIEGISEIEGGLEGGFNLNFWFASSGSWSIGVLFDSTWDNIKGHDDMMNPMQFKFFMGPRIYLKGIRWRR